MQHDSSVGSAAHPAVADAPCRGRPASSSSAVAVACLRLQAYRGSPSVHSRAAPARYSHPHRAQDRRCERGSPRCCRRPERARVLDQVRGGSCRFDDGAGWGEVAAQHGDAAFVKQRLTSQPDHFGVPDGSGVQVVDEWVPTDGDGRRVEEIAHLPQGLRAVRRHGRSHPSRTGPPAADRPAAGHVSQSDRKRRVSGRSRAARQLPAGGPRR
jgi:hypothetical protein